MHRLLTLALLTLATTPFAQDWGQMATISSTMGVQSGKLCLGEASRGDIGCPAYAPSVATNGTLTATKFIGDGSSLTNLTLPSSATDRISTSGVASGAQLGMVVTDRGTVSFTLAGTAGAAYLHGTAGLVAVAVSTTTGNVQTLRILNSTAGEAVGTPGFSWSGDPNTGMYWVGADQLGLAAGGVQRVLVNSSGVRVAGYISTTGIVDAGGAIYGYQGDSVTAPGYTWSGDTNTGMYWVGADQLGLAAGGVQRVLVNTTGATVTGNFTATGSVSAASASGSWVATQAEAEAGTDNTQIMTPLRTKQAIAALASGSNFKADMQVFTSSGTWTKPAGGTKAHVRMVGGGGGGGTNNGNYRGGSGGSGAYAETWIDVSSLSSLSITVGAGGAANANGGASIWNDGTNVVTAGGGKKGNAASSSAGGTGGVGGVPSGALIGGNGNNGESGAALILGALPTTKSLFLNYGEGGSTATAGHAGIVIIMTY